MKDRLRTVSVWGWVLVVVATTILTIWYVLWGGPVEDQPNRAQVSGTLLAAVVIVPPTMAWAWGRRHRPGTTLVPTWEQVAAATEHLATEAAAYWSEQARQQGITDSAPVAVRWRAGPADLAAPTVDLRPARQPTAPVSIPPPGGPDTGQLWLSGQGGRPPAALPPSLSSLSYGVVTAWYEDLYTRLGPGDALVVLGEPGSGKSGALLLLLLEALERRDRLPPELRARARVPVWATCGSWDPTTTKLPEHVVTVLACTYPGLTAPGHGGTAGPAALLQQDRVAVFLDGLDEMPPDLQPVALEAIRTQASRIPVVLTSRTTEFRDAITQGSFRPAGMIELLPVAPDAAASFLQNPRQPSARQAAWQPVIDHLRAEPDSPLGRVLATPLGLCLARDTYTTTDPASLIPAGPATSREIMATLIGAYVEHAYPAITTRDRRHRDNALYWLAWTAYHLGASRDLHWWDPPTWIPRWQIRLLRGLTTGLMVGLVEGLVDGLVLGLVHGVVGGLAFGLTFGLAGGLAVEPDAGPRQTVIRRLTRRKVRAVLVGGLAAWLGIGLTYGLATGLVGGLAAGLAFGLAGGLAVEPDAGPRQTVIRRLTRREVRAVLVGGLAAGLAGLAFGLTAGLAFGLTDGLAVGLGVGIVFGFAGGLAGLLLGLALGLAEAWMSPVEDSRISSPTSSYRNHRSTLVMVTIVVGIVVGIMTGLLDGIMTGLSVGLMAGIAAAQTAGAVPGVKLTDLALLVRHRRGVRFLWLFEEGLDRQLLRQAGIVYQFRHAELQDYLAARYETFR